MQILATEWHWFRTSLVQKLVEHMQGTIRLKALGVDYIYCQATISQSLNLQSEGEGDIASCYRLLSFGQPKIPSL